jgi:hypothetical protein
MLDDAIATVVEDTKASLDAWADLAKKSLHKATTGSYDADSMAQDAVAMWGLAVTSGLAALRLSQAVAAALPSQFSGSK